MSYIEIRRSLLSVPTAIAVLVCLVSALPMSGRISELHVSLAFVPTDAEEVLEKRGVVPDGGPPFEILPAVDVRQGRRDDIGENRENRAPVRIWSSTNVAAWITMTLTDTFRDWGTPSVAGSPLVLKPEIVKLFVIEEHTYQAEAVLKFTLRRRDGTEIWSGVAGGSASRFGRSLKADNYREVISDALFSCYSKLWVDPGFREAWRRAAAPAPSSAPTKASASEAMRPEQARKRLLELRDAGFDDDSLAAWIGGVEFLRPFGGEDMIDLRHAGFPPIVIEAAMKGPGETLEPAAAKARAMELARAGFDEGLIVTWVRRVSFTRALNSSDMIDWKSSGVSQTVIRAAME